MQSNTSQFILMIVNSKLVLSFDATGASWVDIYLDSYSLSEDEDYDIAVVLHDNTIKWYIN